MLAARVGLERVLAAHHRRVAGAQVAKVDVLLFGVSQTADAVLAIDRPANQIVVADEELVVRHVELKQWITAATE